MDKIRLSCDSCGIEYLLDSVGIKETYLNLDEGFCKVLWFNCPNKDCKRIYLVSVQDERWMELKSDLDKQIARQRKLHGKQAKELAKVIGDMIVKKKNRLGRYTDKLKQKYDGRFTLVTTENGTEELKLITMD